MRLRIILTHIRFDSNIIMNSFIKELKRFYKAIYLFLLKYYFFRVIIDKIRQKYCLKYIKREI